MLKKSFLTVVSTGFIFAAFLIWFFYQSNSSENKSPEVDSISESDIPALTLSTAVQSAYHTNKTVSFKLTFSMPVDAEEVLKYVTVVSEDGSPLGAESDQIYSEKSVFLRTLSPVTNATFIVTVSAGLSSTEKISRPMKENASLSVGVEKSFRLLSMGIDCENFSGANIQLAFTKPPELLSLSEHIVFEPAVEFTTKNNDEYDYVRDCYYDTMISGDFLPGHRYTMILRKGLKSEYGDTTDDEIRRTFMVPDRTSRVEFAAPGRYLPPSGSRSVPVMAVNTERLVCMTSRIPVQNIVQMLARENGRYGFCHWGNNSADGKNVSELAEKPYIWTNRLANVLNVPEKVSVPVRSSLLRTPENGVFLMEIKKNADDFDVAARRLICITDLGLSARIAEKSASVWVTSLVSGEPLMYVNVRLYAANNTLVAEGMTDRRGIATIKLPADYETPFVLTASTPDSSDFSFIPLTGATVVDEMYKHCGSKYLSVGECEAFVWSDRGIYRHGENIMLHAIIRDSSGKAPSQFPVEVKLLDPSLNVYKTFTKIPDSMGGLVLEDVAIPDDQPSGNWSFILNIPGFDEAIGSYSVKVEEFVPPQIRVAVNVPESEYKSDDPITFSVSSDHLFGAPAAGLYAEASFTCRDIPFKPAAYSGFSFGDSSKNIDANFKRLPKTILDNNGVAEFTAPLPSELTPSAAVEMSIEGTVFETGGRPVSSRSKVVVHKYPWYIGMRIPGISSPHEGALELGSPAAAEIIAVTPSGMPLTNDVRVAVRIDNVSWIYGYKRNKLGDYTWNCEKVFTPVSTSEIVIPAGSSASIDLPVNVSGRFSVSVSDPLSGVSGLAGFDVYGVGDLSANLSNPSKIEISFDKKNYEPFESPKMLVRAPFTGIAWLSMQRDDILMSRTLHITNCTSEIILPPVEAEWCPNVNVAISMVRPAVAGKTWSAQRASGVATFGVLRPGSELKIELKPSVEIVEGGSKVSVPFTVSGVGIENSMAVVTVVDEGINILTDEKVPNPTGFFSGWRSSFISFYDIFKMLLPLSEDTVSASGVKIGGDTSSGLMRRISPVASRRFKPLSRWDSSCTVSNGTGLAVFTLPEFSGELRATVVAYTASATGSAAEHVKVAPKVILKPDATRFLSPGDRSVITAAIYNRSDSDAVIECGFKTSGCLLSVTSVTNIALKAGASSIVRLNVEAADKPGQGVVELTAAGCGERHSETIEIPVRPASSWVRESELTVLKPGEKKTYPIEKSYMPETVTRSIVAMTSPKAALIPALEYLVGYPYGCLEQTTSSAFPLIHASGILGTLPLNDTSIAYEAETHLRAAISRVCSMQTSSGYSIWPEIFYSSENLDNSLYAAHFIAEAAKAGYNISDYTARVNLEIVRKALCGDNNADSVVYACHILAIIGKPDYNWMLKMYDNADLLSLLGRCHLARAFALSGDSPRAAALMKDVVEPNSVKTASIAILAMLDIDPDSEKINKFVLYLMKHCRFSGHWGTTADNAHALLALGAYYRRLPESGDVCVTASTADDPEKCVAITSNKIWSVTGPREVTVVNTGSATAYVSETMEAVPFADKTPAVSHGIAIERRYLDATGAMVDMSGLRRGDSIIVELIISANPGDSFNNLVVEELLPACFEFEPTPENNMRSLYKWVNPNDGCWVLRREVRDDRIIYFSNDFKFSAANTVHYCVRVVSEGDYIVPAPAVEAMYDPGIRAVGEASKVHISGLNN